MYPPPIAKMLPASRVHHLSAVWDGSGATVGCDTEFLVVAEARYVRTDVIRYLDDHLPGTRLDRLAIDFNVYGVVTHSRYAAASGASSTMLRPLLRTMYSNSS